ncbi:MAG: hypothetical protein ABI868_11835 [Acidobacteriota bacterium]
MVWYYSKLLHQTWFGLAMSGGVPWLWPLFKVLHFAGMALFVGGCLAFNLRLLGVARDLPIGPLRALARWGLLGFAITAITGLGFYAGFPNQYMNWPFFFKMACIVLAGLNVLLYYSSGLHRRVNRTEAGQDVPFAARVCAAASLCLWCGVMFIGRMLPVFSDTF